MPMSKLLNINEWGRLSCYVSFCNEKWASFNIFDSCVQIILLLSSFKISQLTNVHSYKLQAFLSLPVYFSFFNL